MLTLLSLLLAVSPFVSTLDQDPPVLVRLSGPVSMADGSTIGASANILVSTAPIGFYVASGEDLCLARSAERDKRSDAGFGWWVELTKTTSATEPPSIAVKWRRMWENGRTAQDAAMHAAQLRLKPGTSATLDSLTPSGAIASAGTQRSSKCDALSMSLQVGLDPLPGTQLMTAELWLVHTNASGQETTQQQVVRSMGATVEYFFDPEIVSTTNGTGARSISGSLSDLRYSNGSFKGNLKIANKMPEGGSGWAVYPVSASPGEVLSFPLANSSRDGAAKDRLSVRLRLGVKN